MTQVGRVITPMTDLPKLAAGLSEAQKRAVRAMIAEPIHPNDIDQQGGRMVAFVRRGLAYRAVCTMLASGESFNGYGLTPLGLDLRTHLEGQK